MHFAVEQPQLYRLFFNAFLHTPEDADIRAAMAPRVADYAAASRERLLDGPWTAPLSARVWISIGPSTWSTWCWKASPIAMPGTAAALSGGVPGAGRAHHRGDTPPFRTAEEGVIPLTRADGAIDERFLIKVDVREYLKSIGQ
jgi:hypothetical protein